MPVYDVELETRDLQGLSSADAVVGLFTKLGYDTSVRTSQTATNLGIPEAVARPIKRIELLADHQKLLQVYLFELKSVTVAEIRALARVFRNFAGQFLLVLTSDYEFIEFVLLDRQFGEQKGPTAISTAQPTLVQRRFSLDRRHPTPVHFRVLRRFTWTEADPFAQFDKLRFAYDLAHWSEVHFNNRGLFSDYYLTERLRPKESGDIEFPEWREDPKPAYQGLRRIYDRASERFAGKKTSELAKILYEPLLKELGFAVSTDSSSETGLHLKLEEPVTRKELGICLPYPWGRELDRKDEMHDTETPEVTPTFAVVDLLAKEKAPWVVLTNGKLWRLYSQRAHSRATNYYEVDLDEVLGRQGFQQDIQDAFRYFWLLFRIQAFRPVEVQWRGSVQQLSMLDRLLLGSEDYAKQLGENLKNRVFTRVFPVLAEGFIAHMRRGGGGAMECSESDLAKIFQGTLTLLYRLLFLLYAESRDLLPVHAREYRTASLQRLKENIRDVAGTIADETEDHINKHYGEDSYALWQTLKKLFAVIDKGSEELNVPRYNGGLFQSQRERDDHSPEADAARFLEHERIGDRYLARAIDLLARGIDPKRHDLVFVDYKSLGVRQLGSIYEGLLEFHLHIATEKLGVVKEKGHEVYKPFRDLTDREKMRAENQKVIVSRGRAYLENDKRERRATGSYYTPDHIVKYIVERSVGPILRDRFDLLRPKLRDAQRERREFLKEREEFSKRGMRPKPVEQADLIGRELVDDLFNLKVLDPAIGSGHFLVEAVDFITDKTLEFLSAFPWNPVLVHLDRMRATIQEQMDEQNVDIDSNRLTDVNLLKRHVLKRCVYGVDLNAMAVELAKLSLWLDCFTLGAPLSFLDHHLRWGHSLIGSSIAEVDAIRESKGQLTLTGTSDWQGLAQAVQAMADVGGMPDITAEQVADSKKHFQSALADVEIFKRVLDLHTARWFISVAKLTGKTPKIDVFDEMLRSGELFEWAHGRVKSPVAHTGMAKVGEQVVEQVRRIVGEKKFFHWELEFPEVFYGRRSGTQNAVERLATAGFDAIIGNPPYDVLEKERGGDYDPHKELNEYLKGDAKFEACLGGKLNLYRPFVVVSLRLLRPDGAYSQIIPMSFMGDMSVAGTRAYCISKHSLDSIVAFPQKDDENRRVFREAKLSTCIPVLISKSPDSNARFRVSVYPADSFDDVAVECTASLADLRAIDPEFLPIPSCSQQELDIAIKLHSACGRLKDVAEVTRGEINQTIYRDFISRKPSHKPLLKGVEVRMFGFNTVLSQGEREYFDEKSYENEHPRKRPVRERVATQRITGIDETRRLVCAVSSNGSYFADSTNSVIPKGGDRDISVIVGLLNSSVLNWRFSLTSTNNNVGTNELEVLPFPREIDTVKVKTIRDTVLALQAAGYEKKAVAKSALFEQLDRLICDVYGLSEIEAKIVRGIG